MTTKLIEIGNQWNNRGWRAYYQYNIDASDTNQGKFRTDLIDLQDNKFYKIRGQHRVYGGWETWGTVSVEFIQPGSENHPMAAKAVQSWRIEQTNVPETWTL